MCLRANFFRDLPHEHSPIKVVKKEYLLCWQIWCIIATVRELIFWAKVATGGEAQLMKTQVFDLRLAKT